MRDPRNRTGKYILNAAGEPEACPDLLTWVMWMETSREQRVLARDRDEGPGAPDISVSTVFLGLDQNHSEEGPPILWESRVFGGPLDTETWRYTSREEALVGHQELCQRVKLALQVNAIGGFK